MGIIVRTSSQKAEGLKVAPILKAGWLLKKRRMDLRNLNNSITFVRRPYIGPARRHARNLPRPRLRWPDGRFLAGTVAKWWP